MGAHRLTYRFGVGACFMEDDFMVEVLEAPNVELGPDLSVCGNEAPIELNGLPAGGEWTTEDSLDLSDLRIIPQNTPPGIYTLAYSVQGSSGCRASRDLDR